MLFHLFIFNPISAPKFIYSFELDEYVYFVFQETAVEISPEVMRTFAA